MGCSLFVRGALGVWFSYQENRQALILLQQEKARSAAERIGQILFDLEQKIGTAAAPQHGVSHLEQRMVDSNGHLIAHPDIGLVLKHSNMTGLPQVRAAIAEPGRDSGELGNATNLVGQSVLTAFGVIPYLGWIVFVEEPMAQAYLPLYAQALRCAQATNLKSLPTSSIACQPNSMTPTHRWSEKWPCVHRN